MKKLALIIGILNCTISFSQNLEITGGVNQSTLFDYKNNNPHYSSSYESKFGYTFGIAIENIKIDWVNFRFTASYEKYAGKFLVSSGGLAGSNSVNASFDKSILSLGIFPVNFSLFNCLDINIGFKVARLLNERFQGTGYLCLMGQPETRYDLKEKYDRYSAKTYYGIRGRFAYDFILNEKLTISPQYSYYLGLSNEFDEFSNETKSMRHCFSVGLQRNFR